MNKGKFFSGLFASAILTGILGLAFAPRAAAYEYTETQCQFNLCIVYGYIRTTDQNGNFTGYARYEVSRYWREYDPSIDP